MIQHILGRLGRLGRLLHHAPDLRAAVALWLGAWVCGAALAAAPPGPPAIVELDASLPSDMMTVGRLYAAGDAAAFPASAAGIARLLGAQQAAEKVDLFGGRYWLHASVRQGSPVTRWALDPNNTLIDSVEARLYGSDGSVQQLSTGYRHPHDYALHYGKNVTLVPGVSYEALIRFDSPYFAAPPRFELLTEAAFQHRVLTEDLVIIGSLGAMAALALFNLFLYALVRRTSHLYYAAQLALSVVAWGMTFHVPSELFGWHELRAHYVPFFLLPAISSLFCIDFLELRTRHPVLYRLHGLVIAAGLLLAPVAVLALPYAHATATLLISAWLVLMLASGIRSWLGGYRAARFFVLAFVAMLIPALIILPSNIGLIASPVENIEMLTLFGGTVEALLQAFALADRIRILNNERDSYAAQLGTALQVAHTDAMTGIANRYAFDLALSRHSATREANKDAVAHLLLLIDLDGLKRINDQHGHSRGDELLKAVAAGLGKLAADDARCYRIGGDEFAVLAPHHVERRLRDGLAQLEAELMDQGFEQAGISYGIAHWTHDAKAADLINLADQNMYQHKASRKLLRPASTGRS